MSTPPRPHRSARRPIWAIIAVSLLLLTLATASSASFAADQSQPPAPITPGVAEQTAALAASGSETRSLSLILELQGAPVVDTYLAAQASGAAKTDAAAAQQARLAQIQAQQARVEVAAQRLGAPVLQRYTNLMNGLLVHATPDRLADLARIPGVAAIRSAPVYSPTLAHSVPFIGADTVRQTLGLDGRNTTIAIIDTGIDYTHRDFGGPGTTDAYAAASADATKLPGLYKGQALFPTLKIIGGWDFIGERYDPYSDCSPQQQASGDCSAVPEPDPNPIDVWDHGTHVAGIAAGFGVPNDSVNGSLPSTFGGDTVYHGVAPAARLYAYKVFATSGAKSDLIAGAVDRAMDPNSDGDMSDHVDVINMSLGAAFSGSDVLSQMSDRASAAGVLVAAAAGNDGDIPYVAGESAAGRFGLSVASSYAAGSISSSTNVADVVSSFSSRGPDVEGTRLKPDITAPGSSIVSAGMGRGTGPLSLSGTSMATPHIAGSLALMRQLHPSWTSQEVAALLANTAKSDLYLDSSHAPSSRAPISRVGSGRVDLVHAAAVQTVAYDPDGLGNISYGFQTVATDTYSDTHTLRVANKSSDTRTYDLTWGWGITPTASAQVSLSIVPPSVTLAPGASGDVQVTLTIPASALPSFQISGSNTGSSAALSASEIAGDIYVTQQGDGGDSLHVPFYFLGRKASSVSTDKTTLDLGGRGQSQSGTLTLTNTSGYTGTAEVFSLMGGDPSETGFASAIDVQRVGVRARNGNLDFAVQSYMPHAVPLAAVYIVHMDTTGDGAPDWQLFNFDENAATIGGVSGRNRAYLCPESVKLDIVALNSPPLPSGCIAEPPTDFTLNSGVTILSVRANDANLGGNKPFSFYVTTLDWIKDYTTFSDRAPDSGWYTFDPGHPRLQTNSMTATVPPHGAATVQTWAGASTAGYTATSTEQGLFIFHRGNPPGDREVDVVGVTVPSLYLPYLVGGNSVHR
ncbi:MAG: S8 family serine peptidase [Anaerolineae bacterium]